MNFGIIQMSRNEYRQDNLGVRDYKITILGIPIYTAKFTSTNNQAVKQLTILTENKHTIKGFNNETKDLCKET